MTFVDFCYCMPPCELFIFPQNAKLGMESDGPGNKE